MKVRVEYNDNDISKVFKDMIRHKNKDELVKLFTSIISKNPYACEHLFKLLIDGNKLPNIIENGTFCKVHVDDLGYGCNKKLTEEKYGDENGNVIVTITDFRGYDEFSNYEIDYRNVHEDGSETEEKTYVSMHNIFVIEDF